MIVLLSVLGFESESCGGRSGTPLLHGFKTDHTAGKQQVQVRLNKNFWHCLPPGLALTKSDLRELDHWVLRRSQEQFSIPNPETGAIQLRIPQRLLLS